MDDPPRGRPLSGSAARSPDGDERLIPDGLDATLVLVRHGESVLLAEGRFQGQAETPLTAIGRRQADLTAARIAGAHEPPALPIPNGAPLEIVHSPLGRTTETADAIEGALAAAGLATTSRPDAGLLEVNQGVWQGLHRTEIAERYGESLSGWRRDPIAWWAPGGESLPQVASRVRPALGTILARLAAGRPPGTHDRSQVAGYGEPPAEHPWTILVGHDGVFKVALLELFDLGLERFWMWTMDLCAINVVELRAGRPVLRLYGSTAHLVGVEDGAGQAEADARRRTGAL